MMISTHNPARPARNSPFDLKDTHPERKVKTDPAQVALLKELDRGLMDSFPASDPVSVSQPTTAGPAGTIDLPRGEGGHLPRTGRKAH